MNERLRSWAAGLRRDWRRHLGTVALFVGVLLAVQWWQTRHVAGGPLPAEALDAPLAVDVGLRQEGNKLDGHLLLTATARPGVHPRAIDSVVTRVIADVAARGVTVRELERVKNGERASAIDGLSSVLGKAMRLSAYNYFAGTPDFLAQDLARTEALTPADVQRAAAQYLAGKPRVVLTVVPEGKTDLALTAGGSR